MTPPVARWRRLAPLALGLALLIAGGAWWRYRQSPTGAIAALQRSFAAHDRDGALRHLDLPATAASLTDGIVTWGMAEDAQHGRGTRSGDAAMLTQVRTTLTEELATRIERTLLEGPAYVDSSNWYPRRSMLEAVAEGLFDPKLLALSAIGSTRSTDDSAAVDLEVRRSDLDTIFVVTASLRRRGGTWQLVGFDGLSRALPRMRAVEALRLEAANDSIRALMAAAVPISPLQSRLTGPRYSQTLHVSYTVRNASPDTIEFLETRLELASGDDPTQWRMDPVRDLAPGAEDTVTYVTDYSEYNSLTSGLLQTPTKFRAVVHSIVYSPSVRHRYVNFVDNWAALVDLQARRRAEADSLAHAGRPTQ